MDSKELMAILDEWTAGKSDFAETSFKLIRLGCSGTEAAALMKEYAPKKEEEV